MLDVTVTRWVLGGLLAAGGTLAAAAGGTAAAAAERITQADLLTRVIDLDRLATPPPPGERTGMFSSYDRASRIGPDGQYVDWDANADAGHFLGREGEWDVMAELAGPGALTRIWSANPHGTIRFVLDGEVVLEAPFAELLSGRLPPFSAPFVSRGLNSYYPIGFARSCRVLARDCRAYYQINYVLFPAGTVVERFQRSVHDAARAAAEAVAQVLRDGLSDKRLFGGRRALPVAVQQDVGPGQVLRETLPGAGTVRGLYVALTDRDAPREPYALHRCVLRVFFDGSADPAIETPLVDFFASGFDVVPVRSLVAGTDLERPIPLPERRAGQDRFFYCLWPMPYRDGLRIEIENRGTGKRPIGLLLYFRVDLEPPAADALRLHARFRREDPCRVFDYPILEAAGPGRIVGCVLNVDCPRAAWWGEGDEKVWIDGEKFPSYFGTGTEDYFGDAWGLHLHLQPLQGVSRTGPYGKNSAYRWHVPDCINFQQSVRFTIENWQFGGAQDTYYGSVVYWYAPPGAQHFFSRLKDEDLAVPGVRIPGAIEIEGRLPGSGWGRVVKPTDVGADLSAEKAVSLAAERPIRVVLPSPVAQTVRLRLRALPEPDFERLAVADPRNRLIGVVAGRPEPDGLYTVGLVRLEPGDNLMTIQCARPAVVDCWVLEPVPKIALGLEAEDLPLRSAGRARTAVEFATLDWSGGAQLTIEFAGPGDTVVFALPAEPQDRVVQLGLRYTAGPDGGLVQVLLNEEPVGAPVDTRAPTPELRRAGLGVVPLGRGAHSLGLRLQASEAGRNRCGFDALELVPVWSATAVECEALPIAAESGANDERQAIQGASGGAHLWCRATQPGAWVEFAVPVPRPGRYQLTAVLTRSFDYGLVQAAVNGRTVGTPVDTYAPRIEPGLAVELGTVEVADTAVRVRFEVTGRSPRSAGYFFGVDCIDLRPAP